jgi:hypothetical protein
MRICVIGENATAAAIRGNLQHAGFVVVDRFAAYTIDITEAPVDQPIVDGVDSELERHFVNLLAERTPSGRVLLQRAGGNQDDRTLVITVAPTEDERRAVEIAAIGALGKATRVRARRDRRWWPFGFAALLLALGAAPAVAQQSATMQGRDATTGALVPNLADADSNAIRVLCVGGTCTGSGGAGGSLVTDNTTFTIGVSSISSGGVFNDALAALSSGKQATVRITAYRAFHANFRDASRQRDRHGVGADPRRPDRVHHAAGQRDVPDIGNDLGGRRPVREHGGECVRGVRGQRQRQRRPDRHGAPRLRRAGVRREPSTALRCGDRREAGHR